MTRNQNRMGLIRKVHGLIDSQDLEKHRHSQDQVGALLGSSKERVIQSVKIGEMDGEWVSVNRVHMKKYVILYCHGGGYSTGSSQYARILTTKLAESTSMDVLCFDYRLAPEHPYPAACEDAMKAWDYLMLLGYGARDVIVAGDSAGGNLALSLVHKLKQQKRLLPRGLVLLSPWTDLTSSGKTHETRAEVDPVLNEEYLKRMIQNYVGDRAQEAGEAEDEDEKVKDLEVKDLKVKDLKDPMISPLFGDFSGFPPTYIQAGDNEILLSDSIMLHERMVQANVSVKIDVFKGMWHVFQMSPFKTAYDAMEKNAEFIFDICR